MKDLLNKIEEIKNELKSGYASHIIGVNIFKKDFLNKIQKIKDRYSNNIVNDLYDFVEKKEKQLWNDSLEEIANFVDYYRNEIINEINEIIIDMKIKYEIENENELKEYEELGPINNLLNAIDNIWK